MIDIATETIVSLKDAAARIPPAREGRPVSPATLWRLVVSGELEGARFGGRWVTSLEALQRYMERETAAALDGKGREKGKNLDGHRGRRRAAERARAERAAEALRI